MTNFFTSIDSVLHLVLSVIIVMVGLIFLVTFFTRIMLFILDRKLLLEQVYSNRVDLAALMTQNRYWSLFVDVFWRVGWSGWMAVMCFPPLYKGFPGTFFGWALITVTVPETLYQLLFVIIPSFRGSLIDHTKKLYDCQRGCRGSFD
jgi:hypothetical protein